MGEAEAPRIDAARREIVDCGAMLSGWAHWDVESDAPLCDSEIQTGHVVDWRPQEIGMCCTP